MSRNNNFTSQFQNFVKESYEKEAIQRIAWFNKRRSQTMTRPRQLEVFRKKITECLKPSAELMARLPDIEKEARHVRKKMDFNDPEIGMPKYERIDLQTEMRPASPDTVAMLYDGITKEGKGRFQYLRKRYDTIPEKKFTFPIISSWDYGWHLDDVIKKEEMRKPPFGRNRVVHDTFYSRNGIGVAPDVPKVA